MKQPQSVVIDGTTFSVSPLLTSQGLVVMSRIMKLLGPTAAGALKNGGEGLDSQIDLSGALNALADRMDETLVLDTIKKLVNESTTQVSTPDGTGMLKLNFELQFQGEFVTLMKVVKLAFEVNYGDFFGVLQGLFVKAMDLEKSLKKTETLATDDAEKK